MEEPKTKSKETPNTTAHLTETVPLPQDPVPKTKPQPNTRKLTTDDNANFHNSAYFKIRALACQLRPHFTQVLQTPNFRNCKAAHEIRIQMKLMVDLYKQMIAETDQHETFVSAHSPLAGDNLLGKHFSGGHQEGKKSGMPQPKQTLEESLEKKPQTPHFCSEKKQHWGSYVVGGSVSGWNFITFLGGKPIYYGITKESFRRSHKKSFAQHSHKKKSSVARTKN
ncbi:hypothetical protein JRO89_XS11G0195900 [Xanthoceras sorbifolium]|uniref:Uncharacterized protein n=1 Tax=Xanthoceras sorbifolium TaxID=99658 RepID=A0ABQ8HGB2_9ROSI|nr:hypothetical protein JRO89_XS11G0195900 [Xanthoceras sorbifolium]